MGDSNPRRSLWPLNRFRVDPVTTTSVTLRPGNSRPAAKNCHRFRLGLAFNFLKNGGESGIRTRGTPLGAYTRFPVVLLQPLRHLSAFVSSKNQLHILSRTAGFSLQSLKTANFKTDGGQTGNPSSCVFLNVPVRPIRLSK